MFAALALCGLALAPPAALAKKKAKPKPLTLRVESSPASYVTGGNALIAVRAPSGTKLSQVRVRRNGVDVTGAFTARAGEALTLAGVVEGLRAGHNRISALVKGKGQAAPAELDLFNTAITGPIFSGPHQTPFFCRTATAGLGNPTDSNCSAPTAVEYRYRANDNTFKPLANPTSRPADLVQTTTRTGETVDYVVRIESGVINRSIYRWATLAAGGVTGRGWNGRLIYTFGGGCNTGYQQGQFNLGSVLDDRELSRGYSVASSSLNVFETACNDLLSAETVEMVKERVIEGLGKPPAWTIGSGGSGGSIQTQMIGQNYPGLLDGLIPTASFPDNSQPQAPDCRLLTNYFAIPDGTALGTPERQAITGFLDAGTCDNLTNSADVVNAHEGCQEAFVPPAIIFDVSTNPTGIRCSLWDTLINVYGTDPGTGKARRALDNVGVQYGLEALEDGDITLEQFLDLNEQIGGYDDNGDFQPGRAVADSAALAAVYRSGRMNIGAGGLPSVPIIDTRDWVDDEANVHQYLPTYIFRERLRRTNGTIANHVMFRTADSAINQMRNVALDTMGAWLDAIENDTPSTPLPQKVIANKPADAVDACWMGAATRINEPAVIGGAGPCQTAYPPHSLPRNVAGAPLDSFVAKCQLSPIEPSDYPGATPADLDRLDDMFPGGVCDYSKPGVEEQGLAGTWLSFGPEQATTARKRSLKLGAKRVRTKKGKRIELTARLRPCPEVTWQRVTFERRRGKRFKGLGSAIADTGLCSASLQTKSGRTFRATAKPITGYAEAHSKRARPKR